MSVTGELYGGADKERFVVTRSQLRDLEKRSHMSGFTNGFHVDEFLYERKVTPADDWGAEQVSRAEWLHIVTARHLREERKRRRIAERDARRAEELNRVFWGCEGGDSIIRTPKHYRGDGHVTCRRAMESCESQEKVVEPSRMAFYWWACAFKYVWRCWSKEDSESDMRKAIDCLRKCMRKVADG